MQLGVIKRRAVGENARVLTKALPMVRSDDQPGFFKNTSPVKFVDQLSDLLVEVRNAVVICGRGECDTDGRDRRLIQPPTV